MLRQPSPSAAAEPADLDLAGFAPSKASSKEQVDSFLKAFYLDLHPDSPAFVVPSPSLMDAQVDSYLTTMCPTASLIPQALPAPPGLENCGASSSCDKLPFPEHVADMRWERSKKHMGVTRGSRAWGYGARTMDSLPSWSSVDTGLSQGSEGWGYASTTMDSLPSWSAVTTSLDSLPSPRQFMNGSWQPGRTRQEKPNRASKGNKISNTDSRAKSDHPASKVNTTMKDQLEALQLEDPAAVFLVRGINKLGFSSGKILRAFFSRYGEVKAIYMSPSRVKSLRCHDGSCPSGAHWRLRAAPLGFIVMKSAEATARILEDGPEQLVNDVRVRLQAFHRHAEALEKDMEDPKDDMGDSQ